MCAPGGLPFVALLSVATLIAASELFRLQLGAWPRAPRPLAAFHSLMLPALALGGFALIRLDHGWAISHSFGLDVGALAVLQILLTTWSGDTAAYFVGRAFGRRKLAPAISPNKTWEGAIANLVACVLVAFLISSAIGEAPALGLGIGLIVGVFGQVGDLTESALKRRAGVKDSGNLMPGHGGLLDRIDSLLFTGVPIYLLLTLASV